MKETYCYDIHGLVRVRSEQRLPELGYFRAAALEEADIDVRIVGAPARHLTKGSIGYRELLGDVGFSIAINREGEHTEVVASPLIGASPHVLYTNVVEPLLRWTLVRKGYALMHGAGVAFGEEALFITAQTDTGKTTTILHTLRENLGSCEFLSDDMTILEPGGRVWNFPKPLTISRHTLQAIGGAPLGAAEKAFLQVQSRLHSKGGRRVGMWLSDNKTPAATLNALVQMLIPPPKFMVDRLIPGVRYRDRATLARIVLIERGPDLEGRLDDATKVDTLLANADDAYGFPPYPLLADALSSWNGTDLRSVERTIVADAVRSLPAVHLRSSRFDWHTRLPRLVDAPTAGVGALGPAATPQHVARAGAGATGD